LEQAVQGSGESSPLEVLKKNVDHRIRESLRLEHGYGTSGHGLAGMLVMG